MKLKLAGLTKKDVVWLFILLLPGGFFVLAIWLLLSKKHQVWIGKHLLGINDEQKPKE